MYTMVLMAALSGSPDAASFGGGLFGGGGCGGGGCYSSGCSGAVVVGGGCCGYSSCFGSSCYSSCSGCCGGRGGLFGGGLFGGGLFGLRNRGGSGCCGGYSSCHGSAYLSTGCCGGFSYGGGCHSSGFSYGGCCGGYYPVSGPVTYGAPSYFGSSYYSPYGGGCNGFGGGAVWYGPDFKAAPVPMSPPIIGSGIIEGAASRAVPTITIDNTKEFRAAEAKPAAAPARLTVELPASAKLYVDGGLVKGDGASRTFHTPDLAGGRTFYYELKAEVLVGGKTVSEERRVVVKAGDALTESFAKLIAVAKETGSEVAAK